MTLGERIGYMRKAKGLTQEALSELMDVTPQAVSKWECSQSCPDIMALPKLSKILGCTIDELLTGEKPEVKEEKSVEVVEPEVVDFEVPAVMEPVAVTMDMIDLDSIQDLEIVANDNVYCREGCVTIHRAEEGVSSINGEITSLRRENGKIYMELEENSVFELYLSKDSKLENLSVETVATKVDIKGLSFKKLNVDTVSAMISIVSTKVETKAELNTVSGIIFTYALLVETLDAESVSGNLNVSCDARKRISAGTVSGRIEVDSCFTKEVTIDTVSGIAAVYTYNNSPEIHFDSMKGELNAPTYMDPHDMKITADTVSGKITVRTVNSN